MAHDCGCDLYVNSSDVFAYVFFPLFMLLNGLLLFHSSTSTFLCMKYLFFTFMPDDRGYAYTQCCFAPLRHCFELLGKLMFFSCYFSVIDFALIPVITIFKLFPHAPISHFRGFALLTLFYGRVYSSFFSGSFMLLSRFGNIGICLSFHVWEFIGLFAKNDNSLLLQVAISISWPLIAICSIMVCYIFSTISLSLCIERIRVLDGLSIISPFYHWSGPPWPFFFSIFIPGMNAEPLQLPLGSAD